jgi:threonine/homoserine/homoserine lactone efflux protein
LLGFVLAVIVLVFVPGPNTIIILAHSLGGGRKAGFATLAGVETGTLFHTIAAQDSSPTLRALSRARARVGKRCWRSFRRSWAACKSRAKV